MNACVTTSLSMDGINWWYCSVAITTWLTDHLIINKRVPDDNNKGRVWLPAYAAARLYGCGSERLVGWLEVGVCPMRCKIPS